MPTDAHSPLPLVAIGASAGGLNAIERVFARMPPGLDAAFVLIQHLSPHHRSYMDDIMRRRTLLTVIVAEDGMKPRPDSLYLLPPGHEMAYADGALRLRAVTNDDAGHGRLPIDTFFRSLAKADDVAPILVVLSGTGSDGTAGIVAAKQADAFVIAQDESSAQFSGMPHSAVETGLVDEVCPPEEVGAVIAARLQRRLPQLQLPPGSPDAFHAILHRIEHAQGIDFRAYKVGTIYRRIARRMQIVGVEDFDRYLALIENDPAELGVLFDDLLINVTSFFRDPAGFDVLERAAIEPLLAQPAGAGSRRLRCWVAGCATGEEAYSLAMLALDAIQARGIDADLRIFATDVHAASLAIAGKGCYPPDRLIGVSAARLEKYWTPSSEGYVATETLRRAITFARHDVLRDAPFTNLDLVTCRNLLIYFESGAQHTAISRFAFGLKPGGTLMLGASEGLGVEEKWFEPVDDRFRIFRRSSDPIRPRLLDAERPPRHEAPPRPVSRATALLPASPGSPLAAGYPVRTRPVKGALLDVQEALLERYVPPGVLVDGERMVVQVFGDAHRYLKVGPGRVTMDLMDVLDEALRGPVSSAMRQASREPVESPVTARVKLPGKPARAIRLSVEALKPRRSLPPYFLITLDPLRQGRRRSGAPYPDAPGDAALGRWNGLVAQSSSLSGASDVAGPHSVAGIPRPDAAETEAGGSSTLISRLHSELEEARSFSQATSLELEIGAEELQTANEELMATNEELQASNEELNSVNEEMHTINTEYQRKIDELRTLNRDMDVLLTSTDIGTLFLEGDELRIRRYTPFVGTLFNLDGQDVGRSLDIFQSRLTIDDLPSIARRVLRTGRQDEREVLDRAGNTYLLRIVPNIGPSGRDGVVVTLVNINRTAAALAALQAAQRDLQELVDALPMRVVTVDTEGRCETMNQRFVDAVGHRIEDAAGKRLGELLGQAGMAPVDAYIERVFAGEPQRFESPLGPGVDDVPAVFQVDLVPRVANGRVRGFILAATDITALKEVEHSLAAAREAADAANRAKSDFLANMSHEIRTPLTAVLGYADILGGTIRDPDNIAAVNAIQRNSAHLLDVINDILDLSKIEAGRLRVTPTPVDVDLLVGEAFAMLKTRALEKGLRYELSADGMIPASICTDRLRVRQILLNLIGNAIKFTDKGSVLVTARLASMSTAGPGVERVEAPRSRFVISVADTGPGIPAPLRASLFTPFAQAEGSANRAHEGTGLGLAISQRLAAELGGEVGLASSGPEGAVFELHLPVTQEEHLRAGRVAFEPLPRAPSTDATFARFIGSPSFLVVDDRRDIRLLVQHLLEEAGGRVETAAGGREALRVLSDGARNGNAIDAVVMDMQMPDMDGYEATRELRRTGYCKPIVALTAGAMAGDESRCLAAGCSAYLPKPVDRRRLVLTLASLLRDAPETDAAKPTPTSSSTAPAAPVNSSGSAVGRRVMVADDNADVAAATAALLEIEGFEACVAHSGEEALGLATRRAPDVLLLDLGLPDMDGLELARRLRALDGSRDAVLVALTGRDLDPVLAREAGFDATLLKPASIARLREGIGRASASRSEALAATGGTRA